MANPLIEWSERFEQELVREIALGTVLEDFPRLIDADLFIKDEHQIIVKTALDYHAKHEKAPGAQIETLLARPKQHKDKVDDVLAAWGDLNLLEEPTPYAEMRPHIGARCLYRASRQKALLEADWLSNGTFDTIEEWYAAQKDLNERVERIQYAANSKKPFKMIRASAFEAPPVSWVVKGLVPAGMLSMVAGKDGLGKSLLAMEIGRCVLTGDKFLGKFEIETTGPVLYLAMDDPDSLINDRLKDLGIKDHPDLYVPQDIDCSNPIQLIRHTQDVGGKMKLIVLDCLYRLFPQKEGASNDASAMGPLVAILNTLAQKTGAAVIVIHHENKKGGGDIAGSFAIRASLKVLLKVSKPDQKRREDAEPDETAVDETERLIRLDKSKLVHEDEWHVRLTYPTWTVMTTDEVKAARAKRVVRDKPHTGKAIGIQFYEQHLGKGQQIACAVLNDLAKKNVPPLTKHQLEDARAVLGVETIRPGNVPTACIPARVREAELREGVKASTKRAKEQLKDFYRGAPSERGAEGAEGEEGAGGEE